MLNHPYLINDQAKIRQEELLAEASHYRLLRLAREWRQACHADRSGGTGRSPAIRTADDVARSVPVAAAATAALAGTLGACGQHAAGSAR